MKVTAEPRSDQWNADDFIGGPRTFTIQRVKPGAAEQKYDIELAEGDGRVWRPPLTVLRVLIAAWGDEAATWQGRRVTLYRDDAVSFGGDQVGGIRVSHLSHIDGVLTVRPSRSRGKRATITVQPLPDAAPAPADLTDQIVAAEQAGDLDQLRALYQAAKDAGDTDAQTTVTEAAQRVKDNQA